MGLDPADPEGPYREVAKLRRREGGGIMITHFMLGGRPGACRGSSSRVAAICKGCKA